MRAPIWCLLCASLIGPSIAMTHACERNFPECVVEQTYQQYLRASLELKNPLKEQSLRSAIAPALLKMLERGQLRDDDYFLKVQDFPPSWAEQVTVNRLRERKGKAIVQVTLGDEQAMQTRVKVMLSQQRHGWQIIRVVRSP